MSCQGTSTENKFSENKIRGCEENGNLSGKLSEGADGISGNGSGLSKTALKKLKSREKWLQHRKCKRVEEKQRKKERRAALKEAGVVEALKRFRGKTMEQSACRIRVVVDMSFDDLMSEKDCRRTVQQLNWCYSANRRLREPLQFYVASFEGPCRKIYDSIESNRNQDIFLRNESLTDLFKLSEIVYLSAESNNVLTELDESKVYVIGGLVDHNSQKGLCLQRAINNGYSHARLPIDEFVEIKTRKVLTINHVFEILAYFSDHGNWEKAFFTVIPPRKGVSKKTSALDDQNLSDEDTEHANGNSTEEDSESPLSKRPRIEDEDTNVQ